MRPAPSARRKSIFDIHPFWIWFVTLFSCCIGVALSGHHFYLGHGLILLGMLTLAFELTGRVVRRVRRVRAYYAEHSRLPPIIDLVG